MAERTCAAVLIVLFACFFYIASIDMVRPVENRLFGEALLLLFCGIASLGWIAFLAAVALAGKPATTASFQGYPQWRPASE